jgi:hypothetical protein
MSGTGPFSWWPSPPAADVAAKLPVSAGSSCRSRPRYSSRTALPSLAIHLGRTKTSGADHDEVVFLTGRPDEALNDWLRAGRIDSGSIFRKIDRWGTVSSRALEASAVNAIVKQRAEMAGLESADYSAHGLRSGYLIAAFPCPRRWSSRAIDRSSRQRATTTTRQGAPARRRGFSNGNRVSWI